MRSGYRDGRNECNKIKKKMRGLKKLKQMVEHKM